MKFITIDNAKAVKKLFKRNWVVAYGNGSFYNKVNEKIRLLGFNFDDVFVTKNGAVSSVIGYTKTNSKAKIVICSSFHEEILNLLLESGYNRKNIYLVINSDSTRLPKKQQNLYKRKLARRMRKKHQELLEQIKDKKKIKVVFLVIHQSTWKLDLVFQKMLRDPFFEPLILVCPYTPYGEERMWEDMQECCSYFQKKGYPLLSSYNKKNQRWIALEEIQPDLVFFTNPHDITRKKYYEDAYLNYLTCYVPYYSDVATNYDVEHAYNQLFHNIIWKQFVSSKYLKNKMRLTLASKGVNVKTVGSPILEEILSAKENNKIWKPQVKEKKRIIFAPHQSILENDIIRLSTFLETGLLIRALAIKYKDQTQWAFKPHPMLKPKLYNHPDWGQEKTDNYYAFWKEGENTQLEDGDYGVLFKTSDALIHDSGSFTLDYLVTENPCAFLELNSKVQISAMNELGLKALNCHSRLVKIEQIEPFLDNVINDSYVKNSKYKEFLSKEIYPLYHQASPSQRILESIKKP